MKKFLKKLLMIIGGITLFFMTLTIVIAVFAIEGEESIPEKTILEIDFEKNIAEYVPDDPVAKVLFEGSLQIRDVVEALKKASDDERVSALVAYIGKSDMGFAQIQEIRNAILSFRKSGKPAIAYAETFGEVNSANGAYYLATAFDEVYLQPSGDIGLTGLIFEVPFMRGIFDKVGLIPRMDHRHEYKNVMNSYTMKKYTKPHREANKKVMESIFGQLVRGISERRGLSDADVRLLIDRGPFLGQEAVDAKLVDGLAYRDEVYTKIREEADKNAEFFSLKEYFAKSEVSYAQGESIALIYGVGAVQRGPSQYGHLSGEMVMGSQTVTAAFRDAINDDDVRAILFRVDSPGGSYVASDAIWRETVRAREKGKPVIVSMGNMAGSGGYFVAMAADKIVAQPGTITGSIGVLGGKILTNGLWDKVGMSWDEIHTSDNAAIWSNTHDYTPEQWSRFQAWLDRVYDDFTNKVSEGRNLPKDKVLKIAKGRIWTGEDAKELGLVDELGGFAEALILAKDAAGIDADERIELKVFPKEKSFIELILTKGFDAGARSTTTRAIAQAIRTMQPVMQLAKRLGLTNKAGVLTMKEFEIK